MVDIEEGKQGHVTDGRSFSSKAEMVAALAVSMEESAARFLKAKGLCSGFMIVFSYEPEGTPEGHEMQVINSGGDPYTVYQITKSAFQHTQEDFMASHADKAREAVRKLNVPGLSEQLEQLIARHSVPKKVQES